MPIFDAYLMVDWSANSKPKAGGDSIWAAWLRRGQAVQARNLPTRAKALSFVRDHLRAAVRDGVRTLVGFDFAYAYPQGLAGALGWNSEDERAPWRFVWDEIADAVPDAATPDNMNDRFGAAARLNARIGDRSASGPFWACPAGRVESTLSSKRPVFPYPVPGLDGGEENLTSHRFTEKRLPGTQETWKLYTAGSVGSQALLGIPVVRALRDDKELRDRSRAWPFETAFSPSPIGTSDTLVIHAEIWPGVLGKIDDDAFACRDEAQVTLLTELLAKLDDDGSLGTWFDVPPGLDPRQKETCVDEEGWILGAGFQIKAAA